MSSFKFSRKSEERLAGVHPALVKVTRRALELSGVDFTVAEGLRGLETQQKYVASGASRTMNSKHLKQADGWGHAVDLYPMAYKKVGNIGSEPQYKLTVINDWTVDWLPPEKSKAAWAEVARAMKAAAAELNVKIQWGGDWLKFKDGPHYEL